MWNEEPLGRGRLAAHAEYVEGDQDDLEMRKLGAAASSRSDSRSLIGV
jgi:hypothetical protein